MIDSVREKTAAAEWAVRLVEDGMKVGLGTGSTATIAIRLLGERVRKGLDIVCIPTSIRTQALAEVEGIRLTDFTKVTALDITIDGCDEGDRERRLVKGGGGALLREKIVASVTKHVVIIADSTKLVDPLGKFPLPVEVVKFAWPVVASRLRGLGAEPKLRLSPDGTTFLTDEGNYILDGHFGSIKDPERLGRFLSATPGVVEHGLFVGMAHDLVIGRGDSVEVI
jgi:ribose 5-phosphate isomerase A